MDQQSRTSAIQADESLDGVELTHRRINSTRHPTATADSTSHHMVEIETHEVKQEGNLKPRKFTLRGTKATNVIALLSLVFSIITVINAFLTNKEASGSYDQTKGELKASFDLARWQSCVQNKHHPQVKKSLWCGVYTSSELPLDYLFTGKAMESPEYISAVRGIAEKYVIEHEGVLARMWLPHSVKLPDSLVGENRKDYHMYEWTCFERQGLGVLEQLLLHPDNYYSKGFPENVRPRLLGNISDLLRWNEQLIVEDSVEPLNLENYFEVPPGFTYENCRLIGYPSRHTFYVPLLPLGYKDLGPLRWKSTQPFGQRHRVPLPVPDPLLSMTDGHVKSDASNRWELDDWEVWAYDNSWLMKEYHDWKTFLEVGTTAQLGRKEI